MGHKCDPLSALTISSLTRDVMCRLRNDGIEVRADCVEWDIKLYYTIPCHTIPYSSDLVCDRGASRTIPAALFWTRWSLSMLPVGAPWSRALQ